MVLAWLTNKVNANERRERKTLRPNAQRIDMSVGGERQKRYRRRQARGIQVVPVEIGTRELQALIDTGWLPAPVSENPFQIARAIKGLLHVLSGNARP
jgi:hypothetical protein